MHDGVMYQRAYALAWRDKQHIAEPNRAIPRYFTKVEHDCHDGNELVIDDDARKQRRECIACLHLMVPRKNCDTWVYDFFNLPKCSI